jgi:MFS family permease
MAGDEDRSERLDRELIELLNELRVALPGVQVLFAFLLIVPFSDRFDRLDASDRRVYFAAVLATVASTICLMAPTAHHRLRFRSGIKEQLLRVGNVFAIVGLVLLAFAMAAVTYVITDEIYPGSLPRIVTSVLVAAFVVVWFVLPVFFRRERTPEPRAPSGH